MGEFYQPSQDHAPNGDPRSPEVEPSPEPLQSLDSYTHGIFDISDQKDGSLLVIG